MPSNLQPDTFVERAKSGAFMLSPEEGALMYGWDEATQQLVRDHDALIERVVTYEMEQGDYVMTPAEVALTQAVRTLWDLYRDRSVYVEFPWPEIRKMAGAVLPKDLVVIGAATGAGKTTFALNLLDALVEMRMPMLFVGLEQDPMQLRAKWACYRNRLDPDLVLTGQWDALPEGAAAAVSADLVWQVRETTGLVEFAAERFVTKEVLATITRQAKARGAKIVIVDHVHRISHGQGKNPFEEFSATVRAAKELAVSCGIVMILMAQFNRGEKDPKKRLYSPPVLSDLRGGGTIEEEADLVLGLARVAKAGLSNDDWEAFRENKLSPADMMDPNAMRVYIMKHRRAGKRVGQMATLHVEDGRIVQRYDTRP